MIAAKILKRLNANKLIIILLGFIFSTNLCASQIILKGFVRNSKQEPIAFANIVVKKGSSIAVLHYTYTNETGAYKLNLPSGLYKISFSNLGYETKTVEIEIQESKQELQQDMNLKEMPFSLNEVVVKTSLPIKIKKDTIIFNAKSFLKGDEQVVEDLLKKIPGIKVLSDGTIKIGNQEIEKLMIDGDDLLESGYKILSKNMPVKPIDKIELFQNYSNNKHLKGIENSQKVALNLTLKENAKNIWFGNTLLGYGLVSANRYEFKTNVMNFGKKNKYFFLSNLNNVGFDAVGDINHLIRPNRYDEVSHIGDNQSAFSIITLNPFLPDLKLKRIKINNDEMISLNSIFTLSKKDKLKVLLLLNTDENSIVRNKEQYYNVGDTNFQNLEKNIIKNKQITGFAKLDYTSEISKTKTLELSFKINKTNDNINSDLKFNNTLLNENLNSYNHLLDQKIVFTNKYKPKKVIIFTGRYINEATPQDYTVNQFVFQGLFPENANNTKQYSRNKMQFAGIETHLFNKLENGNLFELKIGNQFRKDELDTRLDLFPENSNIALLDNYKNNLSYTSNDLYISVKQQFKFKTISIAPQFDIHQLFNQLLQNNTKSNQTPLFINPKFTFDWEINDKSKIILTGAYNSKNNNVSDLYSGFIHTAFRDLTKGVAAFNQLRATVGTINYTNGNWNDTFFFNTLIIVSKNHDYLGTNSTITQNYNISEKILIKNQNFISLSSDIDYYFRAIKSNMKVFFNVSVIDYKNVVNNSDLRKVMNNNTSTGVELRSGFKSLFNFHIGTKYSFSKVVSNATNSFTDNLSFLNLSFIWNKKVNFQVQSERYYFGNLDNANKEYYFLDFEGKYTLKNNKITFFISANNLFNTKVFKNYTVSDVYITKTEFGLMPRYMLLKLEYKF